MKEIINIAELLEGCHKGTKLYSPIFGDVYLDKIRPHLAVVVTTKSNDKEEFLYDGRYGINGECCIFPSKENRDWSKFKRAFKDGDVIANDRFIAIFHKLSETSCGISEDVVFYHCWYHKKYNNSEFKIDYGIGYGKDYDFASDEEKQILFDAIKKNGYKWNAETKTLEKLVEPKFKVGDKIRAKHSYKKYLTDGHISTITSIKDGKYYSGLYAIECIDEQDDWELVEDNKPAFKVGDVIKAENPFYNYRIKKITDTHYTLEAIPGAIIHNAEICGDKNWKLIPNKFDISTLKPFESRVLVRNGNGKWFAALYSHYDKDTSLCYCAVGGLRYEQCIPYENNWHLLGTRNDCDDFYKNW